MLAIPHIGEEVSAVGFGCWPMSGAGVWTGMTEDDSVAAARRAIELGVNFFDVAPVYGLGRAEEVLGRALRGIREEVLIATKCGLVWDDHRRVTNNLTGASLSREVESSLRRLGTDYVDICQMHWPDPATPIEESMEGLVEIQQSGKIRHIGVSNFSIELTLRALAVGPIATYQGLMNMLEPNAASYHGIPLEYRARDEVLPFVHQHEMSFLPYSPLLQGLLTDSYNPDAVADHDVRRENPKLFGDSARWYSTAAGNLRRLAGEIGKPLEQIAVNWLLAQPGMGPVIAGAQDVGQAESIAGAGAWELTSDELTLVDAALADLPPGRPSGPSAE